jgi:hypothetical protein
MYSDADAAVARGGLPHRRSPDIALACSSPGLIAAYHVLCRLLAPRHPPCTLRCLTTTTSGPASLLLRTVCGCPSSLPLSLVMFTLLRFCSLRSDSPDRDCPPPHGPTAPRVTACVRARLGSLLRLEKLAVPYSAVKERSEAPITPAAGRKPAARPEARRRPLRAAEPA